MINKNSKNKMILITTIGLVVGALIIGIPMLSNRDKQKEVTKEATGKGKNPVAVAEITSKPEVTVVITPEVKAQPTTEIKQEQKTENKQEPKQENKDTLIPEKNEEIVVPLTEIQQEKTAPPSEPQVKNPVVEKTDSPKIDTPEKPKEPAAGTTNDKGEKYVPGFGWVKDGGQNQGKVASDMYQNGNKIGKMD